jgi:ribosomal protein L7/L12
MMLFNDEMMEDIEILAGIFSKVSKNTKKHIAKLIIDITKSGSLEVTTEEINAGKNKGKLEAVKLYKARTGLSLMESKNNIETCFTNLGLEFYKWY